MQKKQPEKQTRSLHLQLPGAVFEYLECLSKETGKEKEVLIIEAILEYLDDLKDIKDAEQILISIRNGQHKRYTIEEVERKLGLDEWMHD